MLKRLGSDAHLYTPSLVREASKFRPGLHLDDRNDPFPKSGVHVLYCLAKEAYPWLVLN